MLVLDTDVLTLVQNGDPAAARLQARIAACGRVPYVTIVTLEEQFRGRLADCARANTPERYAEASRRLRATFEDYIGRNLIDFDDRAVTEFKRLKQLKVRIGTMDLRIASITMAHAATLISRNLRDYQQVPGLLVEDWTA
jgi:tRNA(fMet)-specific endonuclease VapC